MFGLILSPGNLGRGIIQLLESLGLQGFPLFLAGLAISAFILVASYLIATWRLNSRKRKI
jgi:hypothetical protein